MQAPVPPAAVYLDASATTPPAAEVLAEMAEVQSRAWANPSSLHGFGLVAAEALERARWRCAHRLGCSPPELVFTSGGTEAIHLALLGHGATLPTGRLLISAVGHPATLAGAAATAAGAGTMVCERPAVCRGGATYVGRHLGRGSSCVVVWVHGARVFPT